MGDEYRSLRDRYAALEAAMDRAAPNPPDGTARRLVQVYNAGSMPTATDHYFAANPVDVGSPEVEGGSAVFSVNSNQTLYVDVVGAGVPSSGDYLTVYGIGGRWIAEMAGNQLCPCSLCCEQGTFPSILELTISGYSLTLGPFTLSRQSDCLYLFSGVVTFPGVGPCAGFNTILIASVTPIASRWTLTLDFGIEFSGGALATGPQPGDCINPLGDGTVFGCVVPGSFPPTSSIPIILAGCPTNPYTASGNILAFTSIIGEYLLAIAFGLTCGGGNPPPLTNITYTLTGRDYIPFGKPARCHSATIQVTNCGLPAAGLTVNIYDKQGGTLLTTCTTDNGGRVYSDCTGYGSYYVTVTGMSSRFAPYGQTLTLDCGTAVIAALVAAPGYVCVPGTTSGFQCPLPIATVLKMSDPILGNATLNYVPASSPPTWTGTNTYSFPGAGCRAVAVPLLWTFIPSQVHLSPQWSVNATTVCPSGAAPTVLPISTFFNDDADHGPCNFNPPTNPFGLPFGSWTQETGDPTSDSFDCPPAFEFNQNVVVEFQDVNNGCSTVQMLYQNWGVAGTVISSQTVTE